MGVPERLGRAQQEKLQRHGTVVSLEIIRVVTEELSVFENNGLDFLGLRGPRDGVDDLGHPIAIP